MIKSIEWSSLAETLGTITRTEGGWTEAGGTNLACRALAEVIGDEALRDAVDFYVSAQPGYELARSVLWLLSPPAAMERCREIFRNSDDPQEQADAINLLMVVADRRVLSWIPEFLDSDNEAVRLWAVGIVDQLWIMKEDIEREDAMPLIERALANPSETVRAQARQVLEMAEHAASFDASEGGTSG